MISLLAHLHIAAVLEWLPPGCRAAAAEHHDQQRQRSCTGMVAGRAMPLLCRRLAHRVGSLPCPSLRQWIPRDFTGAWPMSGPAQAGRQAAARRYSRELWPRFSRRCALDDQLLLLHRSRRAFFSRASQVFKGCHTRQKGGKRLSRDCPAQVTYSSNCSKYILP
jgi:hypothetical protein